MIKFVLYKLSVDLDKELMAFSIENPLEQPIKPALIRQPALAPVQAALCKYLTFIYLIIIFLLIIPVHSCSELRLLCLHHLLLYHYLLLDGKAHEVVRRHPWG